MKQYDYCPYSFLPDECREEARQEALKLIRIRLAQKASREGLCADDTLLELPEAERLLQYSSFYIRKRKTGGFDIICKLAE